MNDQSLINRIRALLNKAESTNHPAEADAFNAKATELMARYAIDANTLGAGAQTGPAPITRLDITVHGPYETHKSNLLNDIVTIMGGAAIRKSKTGGTAVVAIYGTAQVVETVNLLFASLMIQGAGHLARTTFPPHLPIKVARNSWWFGFRRETSDRLEATYKHDIIPATPGYGLVLVDDRARANRMLREDANGQIRSSRSKATYNAAAHDAGRSAARNTDVGATRLPGQHLALGR